MGGDRSGMELPGSGGESPAARADRSPAVTPLRGKIAARGADAYGLLDVTAAPQTE